MNAQRSADRGGAIAGRGRAADFRLWWQWVLANMLGGLVALGMAAEFPWSVGVFPSGDPANVAGYSAGWAVGVAGLAAGAVLGGIQWRLGRGRFAGGHLSGGWWVAASALGFGLSFMLAWGLSGRVAGAGYAHHGLPHAVDRAETWGGLLIALGVGAAQWLVLQVRGAQGARGTRWVLVSVASFTVAWWVAAMASAPVEAVLGPLTHFWGGAVFGLVFGALTGSGLIGRAPRLPVVRSR
jgi:hypothetical protein